MPETDGLEATAVVRKGSLETEVLVLSMHFSENLAREELRSGALGYMLGTTILTPDLWIEPLGALVKTGPAIVLMLVALLILDDR